MPSDSLSKLGFWSAVLAALFSVTFSVSALLGAFKVLPFPWDPVIPDGASLLLALSFMIMMSSIHHAAAAEQKHWSQVGVAFAILYATLVSIVYFVICTVVVPYQLRGELEQVAPFVFNDSGSFMQALDGFGYFCMSLATWFAAPVFAGAGQAKWLRRLFTANGVLGIPILVAYMPLVVPQPYALVAYGFGFFWMLSVPACAVAAALHFRREVDRVAAARLAS